MKKLRFIKSCFLNFLHASYGSKKKQNGLKVKTIKQFRLIQGVILNSLKP